MILLEGNDVESLIEFRERHKRGEFINVVSVLCLACLNRWVAGLEFRESVFDLECTECKTKDSFASFLPENYLEQFESLQ